MKVLLIAAVMAMTLMFVGMSSSPVANDITPAQRSDIHQVARYRMFAYATVLYLNANPSFTGTLTWATLGPAASTPPGLRNASMPLTFKAVVASASSFVICGELSEAAATSLGQLMPAGTRGYRTTTGSALVLTTSQSSADAEGAKCS